MEKKPKWLIPGSNGKIYVVVAVVLVILAGLIFYW
jgi:hypothetical protein